MNVLDAFARGATLPSYPTPDFKRLQSVVAPVVLPPDRRMALACIAKRTYSFDKGRLELADVQDGIEPTGVLSRDPESGGTWLLEDGDIGAPKPYTDVVLRGSAHAASPTRELHVAVAVGASARRLRVVGKRFADVSPDGTVRFSTPEPFQHVALVPMFAYGGCDLEAQNALAIDKNGTRVGDWPEERRPKEAKWLYQYARNPVGTGFFIDHDRRRADGAPLPQVEDPADPLMAERFFVESPKHWLSAPVPGLFGWVEHSWYPRIARMLGVLPDHDPPERPERESTFADGGDLVEIRKNMAFRAQARGLQGAPPGLAVERLRGDELVLLENLHSKERSLKLSLPGEVPRLRLDVPKLKTFDLVPVLQTVRIEPDSGTISLTWCGTIRMLAQPPPEFLASCKVDVEWRKR